jgi:hypothetical protein
MARVLTGRRQQLYSGRKAAETNEALLDTAGTTSSLNTRDTEVASPYPATVGMARVLR